MPELTETVVVTAAAPPKPPPKPKRTLSAKESASRRRNSKKALAARGRKPKRKRKDARKPAKKAKAKTKRRRRRRTNGSALGLPSSAFHTPLIRGSEVARGATREHRQATAQRQTPLNFFQRLNGPATSRAQVPGKLFNHFEVVSQPGELDG